MRNQQLFVTIGHTSSDDSEHLFSLFSKFYTFWLFELTSIEPIIINKLFLPCYSISNHLLSLCSLNLIKLKKTHKTAMQWIQMGCQQMSFIKDNIVENSNIKSQIPLKCDFLMRRTIHSTFVVRKFLLFFLVSDGWRWLWEIEPTHCKVGSVDTRRVGSKLRINQWLLSN